MEEIYKNYYILQILLTESTKLLRKLFHDIWKQINKNEWADNEEAAKYFQKAPGKDIRDKCRKLQKFNLDSGNSADWDITLYGIVLSSDLFAKPLRSQSKNESIRKLIEVRNKLSHTPRMIISDKEFKELSQQLSTTMTQLGATKDAIDKLIQHKNTQKDLPSNKDAQSIKVRGNEEFKNKNYTKAIELYTSALILPDLSNKEVGIMYCNRSLAYLKQYEISKDERDLYRALSDANQTCSYYPIWYKGYARLGEIYLLLNELDKSKENYEKALSFNANDEDVNNSLAFVKNKINEQVRQDHLNQNYQPCTPTESKEIALERIFQHFNNSKREKMTQNMDECIALLEKSDPTVKDVWKGHEYREGSETVQQNYEMAAKYYSKAAQKNNAEALYNLALLTMKGLGVKRDFNTGITLLKKAAVQKPTRSILNFEIANVGVAEAEHSLGLAYENGVYVAKDDAIAAKWYRSAVEHGNANAANNLGLMYLNGTGVEQDNQKAEKLLMFAHERGDPNGSVNLVDLYIKERDPDRVLMWHERSLEGKSLYPMTRDDEIRKVINGLKELKKASNKIPEIKPIIDCIEKHIRTVPLVTEFKKAPSKSYNFDRKKLDEYALNGSITASRMIDAIDHFHKATYMVENVKDYDVNEFIFNLYHGYKTEETVCQLTCDLLEKIIKAVKNVLSDTNNNKGDIDYQCRICFAYLNNNDPSFVVNFLTSSLQVYPNDIKMHQLRGYNYGQLGQYENAMKDFEKILNLQPDNIDNMYNRAITLKSMSTEESVIGATVLFEQFISKAPFDHLHIPEAYYSIASCFERCLINNKNSFEKILHYYEKGIEAENKQLPCFIPYKSNTKTMLESMINCLRELGKPNLPETSTLCLKSSVKDGFLDAYRIELANSHRKCLSETKQSRQQYSSKETVEIVQTYHPDKKQRNAKTLVGLKEILLKDIDFAKDHILKDCILTVTNFDMPIIGVFQSVHFIVNEDDSVRKLCVYNFGNRFESIRKRFPIGRVFSIVNPYIRLAADGKPMIRVDDPDSIILSDKIKENMCRCCGEEDSKYSCSKCKVAKYCSKECQTNDWKILNHKYICAN